MQPDAILFLISQQNLSRRRELRLAERLSAASPLPARLLRLEGPGESLPSALDALHAEGFARILVQAVGLPFSESLDAWLPGALAHWLAGRPEAEIAYAGDQTGEADIAEAVVAATLAGAASARPVDPAAASLGKPGWQHPPAFTHHILVCTGPRCHFRDAKNLRTVLVEELTRQNLTKSCLIAQTGCLFPCNQGPLLALYPAGEWYRLPDHEAVRRFVADVVGAGKTLPDLLIHTVTPRPGAAGCPLPRKS